MVYIDAIVVALCGVAGVAAAALARRARKAGNSALDSERRVLEKSISLLEHDPAYEAERKTLLSGYKNRLKDIRRAVDGRGATPVPESGAGDVDAGDSDAPTAAGSGDSKPAAEHPAAEAAPAASAAISEPPPVETSQTAEAETLPAAAPAESAAISEPPPVETPRAAEPTNALKISEPISETSQTAEALQTPAAAPAEPAASAAISEPTISETSQTAEAETLPAADPAESAAISESPPVETPRAAEPTNTLKISEPISETLQTAEPSPSVGHASASQTADIPDTPDNAREQPPAAAPSGAGKATGPHAEPGAASVDGLTDADTHVDDVSDAVGDGDDLEKIKADIIKTLNKLQRAGDD